MRDWQFLGDCQTFLTCIQFEKKVNPWFSSEPMILQYLRQINLLNDSGGISSLNKCFRKRYSVQTEWE